VDYSDIPNTVLDLPKGRKGRRRGIVDYIYSLLSVGDTFYVKDLPRPSNVRPHDFAGALQFLKYRSCVKKVGTRHELKSHQWEIIDLPSWLKHPRRTPVRERLKKRIQFIYNNQPVGEPFTPSRLKQIKGCPSAVRLSCTISHLAASGHLRLADPDEDDGTSNLGLYRSVVLVSVPKGIETPPFFEPCTENVHKPYTFY